MVKIYLKILAIFLFLTNVINAEIINEIQITGNKRVSKESIIVLGNIKKDENFTSDKLNETLKNLYETNFFSDVNISFENNLLKLVVIENPIIENIEISGIKKKSFVEILYEKMTLKNRMSFTEIQFKKDLDLVDNILKSNGYYFSNIKSSLTKNEDLNSVNINIDIDLGNKARIKQIVFLGDKKIKDKKLLELIASEEHKFWKFISNKVYLNQSLIDLDKRLLENYYKDNGYYEVEILNSFAELNKDGSFKLVFNINAGNKFYFNNLNLSLSNDYDEKDFIEINKTFKKLKNKEYSLYRVNEILNEIDDIASLELYDFIDVEVTEEVVENNKINFNFSINESEKFYVEKINIFGNFNTIEEVLRNNFIVDEGDPYNKILFNKSINNIRALGIFKSVSSNVKDGSTPNKKTIDISVEEKPTGEITLAAGVGSDGSTIGGGITEKNFLGKGISLDANFQISQESIKGKVTYAKPYFNYTDNTLFTSIKSTSEDNLSNFGYKVSTAGLSIGTKIEQLENFYFSPELDFTQEDLETTSLASNNLKKQEGSYSDFYFNYGLDYDTRDSTWNPSKGNMISFYQQLPIVSSESEISNTLILTKYKKLNKQTNMVGKASLYLKAINSLEGSDVRISKRGFIPYHRLRGFKKGKIGPKDGDDFIGGNYVSTLNLSANLPRLFSTMENLDFAYFIDIANVWGVDYDSTIDESSKLRSSTGVSIELISPIGPLSFSFTKPITKKSTDQTETFRFNLGTTF